SSWPRLPETSSRRPTCASSLIPTRGRRFLPSAARSEESSASSCFPCHPEERSDEGSVRGSTRGRGRSLAALGMTRGPLNIRAKQPRGVSHEMGLALMRIQLHDDLTGIGADVGEVFCPAFYPEAEKLVCHRRLLAAFELRDRLERLHIAAIEDERVSILF